MTQSGHRVGRWRSAGAVAEALSVNAKMVVPKRPWEILWRSMPIFGANSLL